MTRTKSFITILSTLPPLVGLSPYTKSLTSEVAKHVKVSFLGFNHIYPKSIYPGKLRDETASLLQPHDNLSIRNVLNWFNPFGWILEAFKINSDVIHAQWWSYPLAPIYITILGINRLRGKKIVITVHNVKPHERSYIKLFLNKVVLHLGHQFIVHTQNNKNELQKIISNKTIHIIPHGFLEAPLMGFSKEESRKHLSISNDDKVLLCFGHIREYKGLDTAIKALSKIHDKKVKLLIAGRCWESWQKYQDIIDTLNIGDRIINRVGFVPMEDIEKYFRSADLILLPYKHFDAQSGIGALILSFKIPFIVSKTGGLTDYVLDEQCVINPDDDIALAAKTEVILENLSLQEKLITDIKTVQQKLNWNNIAKKTIQVYKNI